MANQTIKAENGLAAFAIPASDSLRQFVAFTPEDVQRPLFSGLQKPQDLASVKDAEYLIVTHPLFKAQAEALAAWQTVPSISVIWGMAIRMPGATTAC